MLGCGAIGEVVARELAAGAVAGADLLGVVHQDPTDPPGLPVLDADGLDAADLVVECAGHGALAATGPRVIGSGTDLLVVSVGALTDDGLLAVLSAGPGRVHLCSGAIGGLDLLRAAALMEGGPERVVVTTTKSSSALLPDRPTPDGPVELFRGTAREVAARFPRSTNVVAAVALAVGSWDRVTASVVADPAATRTRHEITASGPSGDYRIEIANRPSERTPTTSAITPYAVLRAVADLAGSPAVLR
ncbi:DUF108 domain-containing protein [Pseudonocardia sp. Ae707_Ps2]